MVDGHGLSRRYGDLWRVAHRAVTVTGLTVFGVQISERRGHAFVLIAESHVSIHFSGDAAHVDVFSCKPFRWGAVLRVLRETFGGLWNARYIHRSEPPEEPSPPSSEIGTGDTVRMRS